MEINPKFDIGQYVYFVNHVSSNEELTCPHCLGQKYLALADGREIPCRSCNERGVWRGKQIFKAELVEDKPRRISGFIVHKPDNINLSIAYDIPGWTGGRWNWAPECLLYATKEEAELAISTYNNKINNEYQTI